MTMRTTQCQQPATDVYGEHSGDGGATHRIRRYWIGAALKRNGPDFLLCANHAEKYRRLHPLGPHPEQLTEVKR